MEFAEIATFAFQTVVTVLIGAVGWGIKNALNELKKSLDDLKSKTKDNEAEIKAVRGELNDLKADLPLVYVLREDFIRVLNNVDTKLDKLIGSSKEGK